MCIDFTDLNKAISKNPYPLPKINQYVDSVAGPGNVLFGCAQRMPPSPVG